MPERGAVQVRAQRHDHRKRHAEERAPKRDLGVGHIERGSRGFFFKRAGGFGVGVAQKRKGSNRAEAPELTRGEGHESDPRASSQRRGAPVVPGARVSPERLNANVRGEQNEARERGGAVVRPSGGDRAVSRGGDGFLPETRFPRHGKRRDDDLHREARHFERGLKT